MKKYAFVCPPRTQRWRLLSQVCAVLTGTAFLLLAGLAGFLADAHAAPPPPAAAKSATTTRAAAAATWCEGDIIFQPLPAIIPLVKAIETATDSEWSHCGVIMCEQGKWVVYEALETVRTTPIDEWIQRGRDNGKFSLWRVKAKQKSTDPFDVEKLRAQLRTFLGKPYDFHYAPDDTAFYCSELVYKAFERAAGLKIGTWQKLGELNWKPFESLILTIEPTVPLERPIISPVALTRSPLIEHIFTGTISKDAEKKIFAKEVPLRENDPQSGPK